MYAFYPDPGRSGFNDTQNYCDIVTFVNLTAFRWRESGTIHATVPADFLAAITDIGTAWQNNNYLNLMHLREAS